MLKKVKKVITDKFFKDNYVKINNEILEVRYAKELYPELSKKILKAHSLKDKKSDIKINHIVFPSNEIMLENASKARDYIYEILNIKKILNKYGELVTAGVLFCLIQETEYNDLTVEETQSTAKNIFLENLIDTKTKEYIMLQEKMNKSDSRKEKRHLQDKLDNIMQNIMKLKVKLKQKENIAETRSYLKSLQEVLIYNRGVCLDFSYAYQFLLNGLGIECHTIGITSDESLFLHAINIIKYKENNEEYYYTVDITKAYETLKATKMITLVGFNENIKEVFNSSKVVIQDMLKLNNVTLKNNEPMVELITLPRNLQKIKTKIKQYNPDYDYVKTIVTTFVNRVDNKELENEK